MKIKRYIGIFVMVMMLSGCTATYNLDITSNGMYESLDINGTEIEKREFIKNLYEPEEEDLIDYNRKDYFICSYWNLMNDEYCGVYVEEKSEDFQYYNYSINQSSANFNYKFPIYDFKNSYIANSYYSAFIFKKYDYDEDGTDDYYMISTSDDFSAFYSNTVLDKITVRIKNEYEVISNNADEVDGNVYIWYLTPDNISSINMVYNPEENNDKRTFFQKVLDGEYTNIFTVILLMFVIGILLFLFIKKRNESVNKV